MIVSCHVTSGTLSWDGWGQFNLTFSSYGATKFKNNGKIILRNSLNLSAPDRGDWTGVHANTFLSCAKEFGKLGPFVSYEENKVLWILSLALLANMKVR